MHAGQGRRGGIARGLRYRRWIAWRIHFASGDENAFGDLLAARIETRLSLDDAVRLDGIEVVDADAVAEQIDHAVGREVPDDLEAIGLTADDRDLGRSTARH